MTYFADVAALARKDLLVELRARETLDDYGEHMTYGEAVASEEMSRARLLPEGLVQGCVLRRDIKQDELITYDDVDLPAGRVADRLRAEQYERFRGETWLTELALAGTPS